MRIVSLLPSTTEIVFALGAGNDLVGVTFDCDFPPAARSRRIVSRSNLAAGLDPPEIDAAVREMLKSGEELYVLDEGALRDVLPDLIISQDLCAVCAVDVQTVDAALDHLGCRAEVLTIDPTCLAEVIASIETIGAAIGRRDRAGALMASLWGRLAEIEAAVAGLPRPRVAVLEWTDPLFAAGHWVPDMVVAAGGQNALGEAGQRSVQVALESIGAAHPDILIVAPCGFHLDQAEGLAAVLLRRGELPADMPVWAVDADAAFVRPGPRLVDGVETLAAIIHPGTVPARPEFATYMGRTSAKAKPSRSTISPRVTSSG